MSKYLPRIRLLALLALTLTGGAGVATADELTDLPLERLLDTEVVSAARFARQVTDAASAVTVLTAEDIRIFGLRTFGEVLDQMRGLHVSHSLDYVFLGARGIGGPQSLAGRVLLLIDGVPAVDNLYDQLYLGHDALIDINLIDRIEYAPGGGSAMYGNNAFLGVINVVTQRGRDLGGVRASVSVGDWNERETRVSWGQRLPNGAEWLLSASVHANTALPSAENGDLFDYSTAHDQRVFFKGQWEGFSLQAMSSQRKVLTDYRPDWYFTYLDRNELFSLGHDGQPAENWRSSVRLQAGRYAYRDGDDDTELGTARQANSGAWWSLDTQFGYDGLDGHRLVLGARTRYDPVLSYDYIDYDGSRVRLNERRRSIGLSAEDEISLTPAWRATAGLRADRRSFSPWTWSPRAAMVWEPAPDWALKVSQGRATRFASASERSFGETPDLPDEQVTTSEGVAEYRREGLRVLGSVYRYRVANLVEPPPGASQIRGRGLELEAEWQWRGWLLRGSHAWQRTEINGEEPLQYAPRRVAKLQASVPMAGEALRASLALRHTGAYLNSNGRVPPRSLLDLTVVSRNALPGLDLRVGWRNLLNQRERSLDEFYYDPPTGRRQRSAWIELTGTFR